MNQAKPNKKKIIILSIVLFILAIIATAAFLYFQYKNDQKSVEVLPIHMISAFDDQRNATTMGNATMDSMQEIFPDSAKQITNIFVEEGDTVQIGDPLLQYNKDKLELDVQQSELKIKTNDTNLSIAQKQLTRLNSTKPGSTATTSPTYAPSRTTPPVTTYPTTNPTTNPTANPGNTTTPTPTPDATPTITPTPKPSVPPPTANLYSTIDENSEPYAGDGTSESPYRYLCSDDYVISASFINKLFGNMGSAPFSALFEVREENSNFGSLISSTTIDGTRGSPFTVPNEGDVVIHGKNPSISAVNVLSGGTLTMLTPQLAKMLTTGSVVTSLIKNLFLGSLELNNDINEQTYTFTSKGDLHIIPLTDTATPTPAATPTQTPATSTATPANTRIYTASELQEEIAKKKEEIAKLQQEKKQLEINLAKAKLTVKNSTVLSTVDGLVKTKINPEDIENPADPVLVVAGENTFFLVGTINEVLLPLISVGDTIDANSWETGMSYSATIVSIDDFPAEFDYYGGSNPNSSSYSFRAAVEGSTDGLSNGMSVDMVINTTTGIDENSIYIERPYVREDSGGYYVLKVGPDARLMKQYVETGKFLYNYYIEVKSNLTMEDHVAFPYGKEVKEGMRTRLQGSEEYFNPGNSSSGADGLDNGVDGNNAGGNLGDISGEPDGNNSTNSSEIDGFDEGITKPDPDYGSGDFSTPESSNPDAPTQKDANPTSSSRVEVNITDLTLTGSANSVETVANPLPFKVCYPANNAIPDTNDTTSKYIFPAQLQMYHFTSSVLSQIYVARGGGIC